MKLSAGVVAANEIGEISSLHHSLTFGQSLGDGTIPGAAAIVSGPSSSRHMMFNGGPRPHLDSEPVNLNYNVDVTQMASLTNLIETISGEDYGEVGMAGVAAQNPQRKMIHSSMARGSAAWTDLKPGTTHWTNLILSIGWGKRRADELGLTYIPGVCFFDHGQADASTGVAEATYKGYILNELLTDLSVYANAQTGRSDTIPLLIPQMGNMSWSGSKNVVLAILKAAEENANIYCLGPDYPYTHFDNVHLTALSYRLRGEKRGQAESSIINGSGWEPCRAKRTEATLVGSTLSIPVHVPFGNLVVDTTSVTSIANRGFEVFDNVMAAVTINSVTVGSTAANTATITLALASSPPSATWRYALQSVGYNAGPTAGSRGNIRDSDPTTSVFDGSPLYNWLTPNEGTVTAS